MTRSVYGVGINDAGYVVQPTVNGKRTTCPFYSVWQGMLERCYSPKFQVKCPTYNRCTVSEEWKTFSNFKSWMEKQNWKGRELDKDILFEGNSIYKEEACVFVTKDVNTFLTDRAAARGQYMLGVSWHKRVGKYMADCSDGKGKKAYLGYFTDELEAHLAWKTYKHSLACKLADEQADSRVAESLRRRYL